MTSRERLMAVLRGKCPDRIPWSPLIDGYYLAGLGREMSEIEAALEVGADVMVRKVPVWARSVFRPHELPMRPGPAIPELPPLQGIAVSSRLEGDTIVRSYETPRGTLTEAWRITRTSPYIPFPVEYLIKEPDDIRVYMHLVEHEEFVPYFDTYERLDSELGNQGLVTTVAPHTPIQHLLLIHMGVETLYYMLEDFRDLMEELMRLMHARNKDVLEIIQKSPAEVAIEYENTGTTYVSPRIYEEFEMPPMDEYAGMLHAAGKLLLVHMCGRLKGLADLIAKGRIDGIIDLAPPPTGDWNLADAKRAWPSKVVGGGLDSLTLAQGTPQSVVEHAREVLRSIAPGDGIILGSGDAVALGTTPENLRAVTRTVEAHGKYPLHA